MCIYIYIYIRMYPRRDARNTDEYVPRTCTVAVAGNGATPVHVQWSVATSNTTCFVTSWLDAQAKHAISYLPASPLAALAPDSITSFFSIEPSFFFHAPKKRRNCFLSFGAEHVVVSRGTTYPVPRELARRRLWTTHGR